MRRILIFVAVMVFLMGVCTHPVAAQGAVVGQIGGTTLAVALQNGYAYIGVGPRLVKVDVSTDTPQKVWESDVLPGAVRSIALSGGYAYVASGKGLHIFDISGSVPRRVAVYLPEAWIDGVTIVGTYAYITGMDALLRILDISSPSEPRLIGAITDEGGLEVAVYGNHAYVASYEGLWVVNLSDPAHPWREGNVQFFIVSGVAVNYPYVYVVGRVAGEGRSQPGLSVVNVSDPQSPWVVGSIVTSEDVVDVVYSNNLAYMADGSAGLRIVSFPTPAFPQEVGHYDTVGWANSVAVSGTRAYVADSDRGLRVIDVSSPTNPREVGFYESIGVPVGVVTNGQYAYVASGGRGMCVVNVSDPASPRAEGCIDTPGQAYGVAITSTLAIVVDRGSGVEMVDVSVPQAPRQIGFARFPAYGRCVTVRGNYAYVGGPAGAGILDISNPAAPRLVGWARGSDIVGIAVSGNYAYLADYGWGIRVVDISNPISPTEVALYTPAYRVVFDVVTSGNYAYVTASSNRDEIWVLDVSDPANPQAVMTYTLSAMASDLAIAGPLLYATGGNKVAVINISDPHSPREVSMLEMPPHWYSIESDVFANNVYVAGYDVGLVTLRHIWLEPRVYLPLVMRNR
ncbi:hypothetical protein [Thermogutta sp.]|uniref:LVIVD repeat-containing protein n=1 Tax=Thermogutta sp. TaxID=1962930 RepID=UPI00321F9E62